MKEFLITCDGMTYSGESIKLKQKFRSSDMIGAINLLLDFLKNNEIILVKVERVFII